jgi:hypothetical protein
VRIVDRPADLFALLPPGLLASRVLGAGCMNRPYTAKEIARIVAGAVTSLVIVGWMVAVAISYMSAR